MSKQINLTKDPIWDLLRKVTIPASVGSLFQTFYNLVDTWFAGRISAEAIGAIAKSFPIYFVIIAVGVGIGAATNACIGNLLEETLSRWKKIDEFMEALENATEEILREIVETHKNLLISSQNIIVHALDNKDLDIFKKANLALRYLSLMKGKDDISQKSLNNLNYHRRFSDFNFGRF